VEKVIFCHLPAEETIEVRHIPCHCQQHILLVSEPALVKAEPCQTLPARYAGTIIGG
jgi:hypothetical protein